MTTEQLPEDAWPLADSNTTRASAFGLVLQGCFKPAGSPSHDRLVALTACRARVVTVLCYRPVRHVPWVSRGPGQGDKLRRRGLLRLRKPRAGPGEPSSQPSLHLARLLQPLTWAPLPGGPRGHPAPLSLVQGSSPCVSRAGWAVAGAGGCAPRTSRWPAAANMASCAAGTGSTRAGRCWPGPGASSGTARGVTWLRFSENLRNNETHAGPCSPPSTTPYNGRNSPRVTFHRPMDTRRQGDPERLSAPQGLSWEPERTPRRRHGLCTCTYRSKRTGGIGTPPVLPRCNKSPTQQAPGGPGTVIPSPGRLGHVHTTHSSPLPRERHHQLRLRFLPGTNVREVNGKCSARVTPTVGCAASDS